MSLEHSLLAWQMYLAMQEPSFVPRDLTYPFAMVKPARAASLTESFLPMVLAAIDRWEKEVLRASRRLTMMLMN